MGTKGFARSSPQPDRRHKVRGPRGQLLLKWVAPLIRRGFVSEACEVDGAGGVEGFLRGAGRESCAQECVFVAVGGGGVDGEAEGVGGAAVAEPEQGDLLAVAEHAGDVGEAAVVSG